MIFIWLALVLLATFSHAANQCNPKELKILNKQIIRTKHFCHFYTSRYRTRSPLVEFSASKLTELCHCRFPGMRVVGKDSSAGRVRPRSARLPYSECNKSFLRKVQAQFREPVHFCKFYAGFDRSGESLPAVPGLKSIKAVQRACACQQRKPPRTPVKSKSSFVSRTPVKSSSVSRTPISTKSGPSTTSSVPTTTQRDAPTIAVVEENIYEQYYQGKGMLQAPEAADTKLLSSSLDPYAAVMTCASYTRDNSASRFQVWQQLTGWSCDSFLLPDRNASMFNVPNVGVLQAYGYSLEDPATPADSSTSTTFSFVGSSTETSSTSTQMTRQTTSSSPDSITRSISATVSTAGTTTVTLTNSKETLSTSSETQDMPSSTTDPGVTATSVKYQNGVTYKAFYRKVGDAALTSSAPDGTKTVNGPTEAEAIQSCADFSVLHGYNTFLLSWDDVGLLGKCDTYFASYTDPSVLEVTGSTRITSAYSATTLIGWDNDVALIDVRVTNPMQRYNLLFSGLGWEVDQLPSGNIITFDGGLDAQSACRNCLQFALTSNAYDVAVYWKLGIGWVCDLLAQQLTSDSVYSEFENHGDIYTFTFTDGIPEVAPNSVAAPDGNGLYFMFQQGLAVVPKPDIPVVSATFLQSGLSVVEAAQQCGYYLVLMPGSTQQGFYNFYWDRQAGTWACHVLDQTMTIYDPSDYVETLNFMIGESYIFQVPAI